jgi:hypothetical protein
MSRAGLLLTVTLWLEQAGPEAKAVPEKMYPARSGCATARNSDARLSRVSRPLDGERAARIGAPRSFAARAEARLLRMTIVRIQPLWNRSKNRAAWMTISQPFLDQLSAINKAAAEARAAQ